jgi:hypothetical protein
LSRPKFLLGIAGEFFDQVAEKLYGAVSVSLITDIEDFDPAEVHGFHSLIPPAVRPGHLGKKFTILLTYSSIPLFYRQTPDFSLNP